MAAFTLYIATPEKVFYNGETESIIITSTEGQMGILAGHLPMALALVTAPIQIKTNNEWQEAALSGGFMQIKNDKVVILVDTAEWPDEIEVNRALDAKKRAEERLHNQIDQIEHVRSQIALQRALTRLKVSKNK